MNYSNLASSYRQTACCPTNLLVSDGVETGRLDPVAVVVETHVTQHHDGAEQQSGGVRHVHAGDVGGGAVDLRGRHTEPHSQILVFNVVCSGSVTALTFSAQS